MVTSEIKHVKTLIIGGGLTGIATAYALQKQGDDDYAVLEAKSVPGGLCATTFAHGYHFDYGGHFLHLHTAQGKALVKQLLGDNLQEHTRQAFVYTNGMHVPVPFQTNLWALYPELRALIRRELSDFPAPSTPPAHFEDWCVQTFGHVLYEAFFRPYNEKLWGRKLTELSADWCAPFISTPTVQEMLQSLEQKSDTEQGYNTQFYYPKTGGCGALIESLISCVKNVYLNSPVTRINLAQKKAWVNDTVFQYENLVNTIPLPQLISFIDEHPDLKQQAARLKVQPVSVYHLAIARKVEPFSWIYFPDSVQPFYRVGLTNYVAPGSVPRPDTSLFYIELPGLPPTTPETEQAVWNGLYQKGIVERDDVRLFSAWQIIPCAYVVFDKERAQVTPHLINALEKQHCYCAGRYGRWEYSFMESSLLQAIELAKKLA